MHLEEKHFWIDSKNELALFTKNRRIKKEDCWVESKFCVNRHLKQNKEWHWNLKKRMVLYKMKRMPTVFTSMQTKLRFFYIPHYKWRSKIKQTEKQTEKQKSALITLGQLYLTHLQMYVDKAKYFLCGKIVFIILVIFLFNKFILMHNCFFVLLLLKFFLVFICRKKMQMSGHQKCDKEKNVCFASWKPNTMHIIPCDIGPEE